MDRRKYIKTIALGAFIPSFSVAAFPTNLLSRSLNLKAINFKSNWENWPDMKWIGPQYWGNRLQDWRLKNGMAICGITGSNRHLQLLTLQKTKGLSSFKVSVDMVMLHKSLRSHDKGCFGIRLGAKGPFEDYRSAAVFGKGLDLGFIPNGKFKVGEQLLDTGLRKIPKSCRLEAYLKALENDYSLRISVSDLETGELLFSKENISVNAEDVQGNFALLADAKVEADRESDSSVGFANWSISGDNLYVNEEQLFGPIYFAQYTLSGGKLKLTAQLAPIEQIDGHKVSLQFKEDGIWKTKDTSYIEHLGRAINFVITDWKHGKDVSYRLLVEIPLQNEIHHYTYEGTIASEPMEKDLLKTAVFSCNFDYGFPDNDVHENVSKLDPDVVLFLGDQFYEATGGFGIQKTGNLDDMCLDYLRKWAMFGWSYRELFRHKPCAIIPDDHDVYHGNVWGEGGAKADVENGFGADAQDSGGYKMPAEWVNMVQFTQTSHLPDPFDPTPVKQNIGVYYTHWNYGGISFAILEDRKFKSAPKRVLPKEAKVWNGFITNPDFDIKKHRNLEAELLGERQHKFLDHWAQDWSRGIEMKVVLSQTNFATVATLPKGTRTDEVVPSLNIPKKGEYIIGDWPTVDMDSNGWPSNKRDRAVEQIRKCFAFHIAGDQHLGSFIRYGIDEYGDSGYAFAGPALNNIWPRRFWPADANIAEHSYENPAYVGNHIDGFGNKMTVLAVANPHETGLQPKIIHDRATGYGLVTFNKKERTIKTECWSRFMDPSEESEEQNPGWPITIKETDNYGRKAVAWLPEIKIVGDHKPVIKIFEANDDLVYALRMATESFKPKVFSMGIYKIVVEVPEIGFEKIFLNVKAKTNMNKSIQIKLEN
ncbi:twin-arginine translocation pathway signal protein [Arenibacter sp. 6A1]|uniref:alkaline phosphatase D family protein n=1 Tax=Arenibacter sp. 6A1 TaxID=2720391 RepID=UPI0014461C2B|nr:alkaline phosphatase D family protein [Arenibacter sp. 6A1]NKI28397.1 twin-arginine translocation pathway signal protein [Arenibacter sp. 6A1]